MDGNGRWAEARGRPRVDGHEAGAESVREVVRACRELGVEAVTLYSFSTENWDRPADEVEALMALLARYLIGERGETLLALQFVVNRIVARQLEGEQLIILDAAGYRERRRNALVHLAERLASKAEKDQKVVKLSPMSPHDRRVFHRALTDNDGVRTESKGEGLYRNLFIIPSDYVSASR